MIGDAKSLARLLYFMGAPLLRLAWLARLIPLRSNRQVEFGRPIPMSGFVASVAEGPMFIVELTDRARESIQQAAPRLLISWQRALRG